MFITLLLLDEVSFCRIVDDECELLELCEVELNCVLVTIGAGVGFNGCSIYLRSKRTQYEILI